MTKQREYIICGNYGRGWEEVDTMETPEEGKQRLKEYRENEPEYKHKLKSKFVKNSK
jgi:hypothetical protein